MRIIHSYFHNNATQIQLVDSHWIVNWRQLLRVLGQRSVILNSSKRSLGTGRVSVSRLGSRPALGNGLGHEKVVK